MLYYLFQYLDQYFDIPGIRVFQYITFRSGMAILFSLLISTIFGKRIIDFLRKKQIGETVRELGLEGQNEKAGTPTMGGIIIIFGAILIQGVSIFLISLINGYGNVPLSHFIYFLLWELIY